MDTEKIFTGIFVVVGIITIVALFSLLLAFIAEIKKIASKKIDSP